MFRNFFSKKTVPLTGAPSVRRQKTYSAQSGYVYQYFYEGMRPHGRGTEFVFTVSADRKTSHPVSVRIEDAALGQWERALTQLNVAANVRLERLFIDTKAILADGQGRDAIKPGRVRDHDLLALSRR